MLADAKVRAARAMFSDPHLSELVTHRPVEGEETVVRAMVRAPDEVQGFGGISVQAGTLVLHVLVADLPNLETSDVFAVRDQTRKVQGQPRRDSTGLIFEVNTVPA